jgi:hypothetical protein
VVEGFFDMAKLVSSDSKAGKTPFEELAYKIGKDCYADIQGEWGFGYGGANLAPLYS